MWTVARNNNVLEISKITKLFDEGHYAKLPNLVAGFPFRARQTSLVPIMIFCVCVLPV